MEKEWEKDEEEGIESRDSVSERLCVVSEEHVRGGNRRHGALT